MVEAVLDLEGEFEAVQAAGAGGVELGDKLGPELRLVGGEEPEQCAGGVGGDGERDERGDRGGRQGDRPVERRAGWEVGGAAFVGGLVAAGSSYSPSSSRDGVVAVV